jgi:transposase
MAVADTRIERATAATQRYWEQLYGDDPLLSSVPGVGPVIAPTIRGFLIDGTGFANAKQVCSYVGMTPSNWSSGNTVDHGGRAITKEGPAVLRLAFYQAANIARTLDPQLAEFYYRLMVERGHCHTQATVAVARKLIERTWTVLTRQQLYQPRDVDQSAVTAREAKQIIANKYVVPEDVRKRSRAHSAATHRAKLAR